MGWVAHPELVAGSCNAGAFGFLAGATIPPEEMEGDILRVKELTDKPFGVNFHMYQPNAADIVDMVIRHGVRAVSYSRSPGPEFIRKLKDAGVDHLIINPLTDDPAQIDLFASLVVPNV